jgi:outer membrane protein TolC
MRLFPRALLVLLAAPAFAVDPAAPVPVEPTVNGPGVALTLEQCVAQALAKNFNVRISNYAADSAQAGVILAQSVYDPVLGVSWQRVVTKDADPLALQSINPLTGLVYLAPGVGLPYYNDQQTTISATENLITGGTVSADYILARDQDYPARLFLNPAYTGDISINVSQPLLSGAGVDYSMALIKYAKLGSKIGGLNLKSSVLTMVFNVESAYFDVIFAQQQYDVSKDAVKLAQQLLDENTIKRQTGVLTDLDVVQAQAGVATAKNNLILALQAVGNTEDTLLQAMGEMQFRTQVGAIALTPSPDTDVSFDRSYKLARDSGPTLAIVQATIDQYQLLALRAKRNVLPSLNVTGGAGYANEHTSYDSAISHVFSGPGYNWQAGINLSIPIGLRQAKAQYRQAVDNVHTGEAQYDQADQTLTVQLRAAVRSIEANRESVNSAQDTVRLSEKQYELQRARFDAGLATSYDVLLMQNQLESSRVALIQAQVNLRIAVADLRFLEGSSLQLYHINLKS